MSTQQLRFCIFSLDEQLFAVTSEFTQQIVTPHKLSLLPSQSNDLLGLFTVQGKVFPLLNIRASLNISDNKLFKQILLVRWAELEAGFGVDSVLDFISLPHLDSSAPSNHLFSVGTLDYAGQEVVALDIPKWLRATQTRLAV